MFLPLGLNGSLSIISKEEVNIMLRIPARAMMAQEVGTGSWVILKGTLRSACLKFQGISEAAARVWRNAWMLL